MLDKEDRKMIEKQLKRITHKTNKIKELPSMSEGGS